MKEFLKRHLGALLVLLIIVSIPIGAAWAKYAQNVTVTNDLNLIIGTKHKLTFDANGGVVNPTEKTLVKGQKYGELPIPTLENCTFEGWYKEKDYWKKTLVTADTVMDTDTTIYAHWSGFWNVHIDPNGGKLYVMDSTIINGASENNPIECDGVNIRGQYHDGAYNNLLVLAKKEGYECTGYFDALTGGTQVWKADGPCISGDKYYKNLHGPRGAVWINNTISTGEKFVFYPQWKANTYTVQYDKNSDDATGSTQESSHTYDVSAQLCANGFSRSGYTFAGWATTPDATDPQYTDKQEVKNLTAVNGATVTMYAVWTRDEQSNNSKVVTFDFSGLENITAIPNAESENNME